MRLLRGSLALVAVALAEALLANYLPGLARYCDLFTILVVYYGLTSPPPVAMLVGAGTGIVEDILLGTLLGMNGFKKTLLGYLVGTVGSLFMLNQTIPRFGILFLATFLDPLAELGLSAALGRSFVVPGLLDLGERALGTGVVGLLFFWLAARLP